MEDAFSDEDFCDSTSDAVEADEEDFYGNSTDLSSEKGKCLPPREVTGEELGSKISRIFAKVGKEGSCKVIEELVVVASEIVLESLRIEKSIPENPVLKTIKRGLLLGLVGPTEGDEVYKLAECNTFIFVSKLAVALACGEEKCNALLEVLIAIIDDLIFGGLYMTRARICNLMASLLYASGDLLDKNQDDTFAEFDEVSFLGDTQEAERQDVVGLPQGILSRWALLLTAALADGSPKVRAAGVHALSFLKPDFSFRNHKGDDVTPNELIAKRLYDTGLKVRLVAIRVIHIYENDVIRQCLNLFLTEKDNEVMCAMANRLAADVHLTSLSMQDRFEFLNCLLHSDIPALKALTSRVLTDSWTNAAGERISKLSIFDDEESKFDSMDASDDSMGSLIESKVFPSLLLEYLDPRVDESATSAFMKLVIVGYIRQYGGAVGKIDFELFLRELKEMPSSRLKKFGVITKLTLSLEHSKEDDVEKWLQKVQTKLFFAKQLIDATFELNANEPFASGFRDRFLAFLLPDFIILLKKTHKFCLDWLSSSQENRWAETIISYLFYFLNSILEENNESFERFNYKKVLQELLANRSLQCSFELCRYWTSVLLDICEVENVQATDEVIEWICYALNEDLDGPEASTSTIRRYASMIIPVFQHQSVVRCSALLQTAVERLVPFMARNGEMSSWKDACELIGSAATNFFSNFAPIVPLLKTMLDSRFDEVKATALNAFVKVAARNGFEATTEVVLGDHVEGDVSKPLFMSQLLEGCASKLTGVCFAQAARDSLLLLSHIQLSWPSLVAILLEKMFDPQYDEYQLRRLLEVYCDKHVTTAFDRAHLMIGYMLFVKRSEDSDDVGQNKQFMEITSFVCRQMSREGDGAPKGRSELGFLRVPVFDKNGKMVFVVAEFVRRVFRFAIATPFADSLGQIFHSMATFLRMDHLDLRTLNEIHKLAGTVLKLVSKDGNRAAFKGFKRFLGACERAINKTETKVKAEPDTDTDSSFEDDEDATSSRNADEGDSLSSPSLKRPKDEPLSDSEGKLPIKKKARVHFEDDDDDVIIIDSDDDDDDDFVQTMPNRWNSHPVKD